MKTEVMWRTPPQFSLQKKRRLENPILAYQTKKREEIP